jgi:hypothetical protein
VKEGNEGQAQNLTIGGTNGKNTKGEKAMKIGKDKGMEDRVQEMVQSRR